MEKSGSSVVAVLKMAILFLLISLCVEFIWKWVATGNLQFFELNLSDGNWKSFIISKILGGIIFGLLMASFYNVKQKNE